ncbi:MAG: Wzz/FepE/Etk N-terminal domain-containing protein [Chloroherpetonaceae bacterium]|nr:Wzz/FepE/Etk N-terminal domain-containing protein [Chloroherpetonaceae bacterium]
MKHDLKETAQPLTLRLFIESLLTRRKLIFKYLIYGSLVTLTILLFMPKTYTSRAVLMPPEDPKSQSVLLQAITGATGFNLGGAVPNLAEELVEVLKSRTIAESVLGRVSLNGQSLEVLLEGRNREETLRALSQRVKFFSNKQRFITIDGSWETPYFSFSEADEDSAKMMSARLATAFLRALDETNRKLVNQRSLYNAAYFSDQLQMAKAELDTAYKRLEEFQRRNKAVAISDQMRVQMQAASEIKAKVISTQIELDLLLRDRLETDPLVTEVKNRLRELESQYNRVSLGKGDNYAIGFENLPALNREYATYFREVKIQEEVYALLKQLYYRERLQGFRDTPTIVVLDPPQIPDLRTSPKRITTLFLGFIFWGALAVFHILISELLKSFFKDPRHASLRELLLSSYLEIAFWDKRKKETKQP